MTIILESSKATGEISELSNTFSEDGHYEVTVTATDGAGNAT